MALFVKNVKHFMALQGINQAELGKAVGLSQPTVQRILSGKIAEPGYLSVQKFARWAGVSMDDLVNRDLERSGGALPSQAMKLDPEILSDAIRLLRAFVGIMGWDDKSVYDPYLLADAYEIASQESADEGGDSVLDSTKRLADRFRGRDREVGHVDERRADEATGSADGKARQRGQRGKP